MGYYLKSTSNLNADRIKYGTVDAARLPTQTGGDHSHSNKTILDAIQESLTTALKELYDTSYSHSQSIHAPSNAVSLSTVKADTDIADAISKKHSNFLDHSNSLDHSHTNKTTLDNIQESLTTSLKSGYDIAYSHSQVAHAPSTAQKNSDITKAEIEAKLIGEISTHSHAGGGGGLSQPQVMSRISLSI